ncbi:MAG: beta-ketoacyl-ACP synthase III [Pseudomonadota bacterium]
MTKKTSDKKICNKITGTGVWTPKNSISNEQLVDTFNKYVDQFNSQNSNAIENGEIEALLYSSSEFIEKASGIKSRYVFAPEGILDSKIMYPMINERSENEMSLQCEISLIAAQQALQEAGCTPADIDAVIVACSNMQRAYPAISIEVQNALGIEGFAFDMNVACASAVFALQMATDMLTGGSVKRVLLINPELCSAHLEFRDRDCHFIFGDACTAMIVESMHSHADIQYEVISTRCKTQFSNNIRNNFGFLALCQPESINSRNNRFHQQGRKVFKEVVPMVAQMIQSHLEDENMSADQLARLWLHQANLSMNELIAKKVLGREASREEAPIILDRYANTSSAGSIIAFHENKKDLSIGSIGLLSAFGAGYSAATALLRRI